MTDGANLRSWEAVLDLQPIVQPEPLKVRGEYRLGGRCGGATLRVKVPADFNPKILALEIVEGDGNPDDEWIWVAGRFAADEGQFEQVRIVAPTGEDATVDIEVLH